MPTRSRIAEHRTCAFPELLQAKPFGGDELWAQKGNVLMA
jgi:hypothetical protein